MKKEILARKLSDSLSQNNELLLKNNVSIFFNQLRTKLLAAVDEYWDTLFFQGQVDLILSSIHEAHQEYYNLLISHNLEEFYRGQNEGKLLAKKALDGYDSANKSEKEELVNFNTEKLFGTQKFTEERLKNDTFVASDKTLARVDDSINEILEQGYKEGWGVKDVGNKIAERFDQLESWEANRIARTEMQYSHNLGIMQGYEELGVEYTQWRSATNQPARTRKSHLRLDGEIVALGELFSNDCAFPGDKTAPIEEWINCRCSNPPFVIPPGMIAPPGMIRFRESDLVSIQEPNYDDLIKNALDQAIETKPPSSPITSQEQIFDNELLDLEDELKLLLSLLEQTVDEERRNAIIFRINQLRNYLTN